MRGDRSDGIVGREVQKRRSLESGFRNSPMAAACNSGFSRVALAWGGWIIGLVESENCWLPGSTRQSHWLGPDKLEKKRRKQEQIDAVTFRALADEYISKLKREGRAVATIAKTEWLLAFAHADLGDTPINAIDAPAVLKVLRAVDGRGRYESAQRLRSTIGSVFRYAIATARVDTDPTYAVRGALTRVKVIARAASTDPGALGALLRAIDAFDGQAGTRIALQPGCDPCASLNPQARKNSTSPGSDKLRFGKMPNIAPPFDSGWHDILARRFCRKFP